MSGGFYKNGREISDILPAVEGPSTSYQAASANQTVDRLRGHIEDADKLKKFEDCLEYCEQALRITPGLEYFLLLKAHYLVLTQKPEEANVILSEVLKREPQNAAAIATLAFIFYHQGNLRKSIEVFNNALQINPRMPEAKRFRDNAQRLLKVLQSIPDEESPKEKFTVDITRSIAEGLAIDPTNREVMKTLRLHQGFANYKNERFQAAIRDFTEALKIDQRDVKLFMLRAKCYKELAMHDDAIIDLMEADKLNKLAVCCKISSEIDDMRRQIGAAYISKTNYELLEVARSATDSDMVLSYNSLSLLYKVNLSKASTEAEKRNLEFKYKRVEHAFRILSDKRLKNKYDKQLNKQESSVECPTLRTCCNRIGNCYQCCCSGTGNCVGGSCTGVGNCLGAVCTGFGACLNGCGDCIANSCCSEEGLRIICNSFNSLNILIAFIILGIFYLIFK